MDKWIAIGLSADHAGRFRRVEDAERDAGRFDFFTVARWKLRSQSPESILAQYEREKAGK